MKNPFDVQKDISVGDERAVVVEEMEPKVINEGSRKTRTQVGEQLRGNGVALVEPQRK